MTAAAIDGRDVRTALGGFATGVATTTARDHINFIGEVERYIHADYRPPVFHRGRYAGSSMTD